MGMASLGQVPAFSQAAADLDCHSRPDLSAYLLSDTAPPNYPLIRQCGPAVIPHLIHLLETETTATNRTLGGRVTQAVSQFGPEAALPLLTVAQTSQNEAARLFALQDLLEEDVVRQIALDASAAELWLPDYHSAGHRLAHRLALLTTLMEGLGHLASTDPSPQIRTAALRPLGDIALELELRPQVAAVGVTQLQHPDPSVRFAAAMMLGEAFYRADLEAVTLVVPALIEVIIDDPEHRPRIAAVGALGFIGPSAAAAVPTLLAVFAEDEAMESAGLALAKIATPGARAAIPLLVARFQEEESLRWANALVDIGADQAIAIPALLKVLATPLAQNRSIGMGFREQAAQLLTPLGIEADSVTALALRQELMWISAVDPESRVRRAARSVQVRIEQDNPHLISAGWADYPTQVWADSSPSPRTEIGGIRATTLIERPFQAYYETPWQWLTVTASGNLDVRDGESGDFLMTLPLAEGIQAAAFSPDQTLLAVVTATGNLDFWHLDTFTRGQRLQVGLSQGQVIALAFAPDGRSLLGVVHRHGVTATLVWTWPR